MKKETNYFPNEQIIPNEFEFECDTHLIKSLSIIVGNIPVLLRWTGWIRAMATNRIIVLHVWHVMRLRWRLLLLLQLLLLQLLLAHHMLGTGRHLLSISHVLVMHIYVVDLILYAAGRERCRLTIIVALW